MKILNQVEITDILYGCTILGTGGGGSLENGLKMIDKGFREGKKFILVELDEVSQDDLIITPYYCGSISPETEEERAKYADFPVISVEPAAKAVQILEAFSGQKIKGIISAELGGGNTAVAFYTAALLDKYIVDGDPAGRSVPGLEQTLYYINDLPITPMAVVSSFGDSAVITDVVNDFRAEAWVRALAVASKNLVAVADHPVPVKMLRKAVIPGAISFAHRIGKAHRDAKEQGKDVAEAVAREGQGKVIFRGTVSDYKWETIDGYTVGEVYLEGIDEFKGSKFKVWYKNEHIMSWMNGEVFITVPDLICTLDMDRGEPVTNPNYNIDQRISVVGFPAAPEWINEKGIKVFGPRSFGFDSEYVSMGQILK